MNPNANIFIPKYVSLSLKKPDKNLEKKTNHVNIIAPTPYSQSKLPEWFIKLEY